MGKGIKKFVREHSYVKGLFMKINPFNLNVPPGHFYSPIPDIKDVKAREEKIFTSSKDIYGVDLNVEVQQSLAAEFKKIYESLPFRDEPGNGFRYYYKNEMYGTSSGALLFCMLNFLKPRRIIEVGSGYSSALMLDTNEHVFSKSIDLTFIEPYPLRLKKLLKPSDYQNVRIIEKRLEDVDFEVFSELEPNDILFIDSTHIAKIGSDVNTLIFEILPRLKKGVYVHIHDILYPFEYPKDWIYNGISWNEAYMFRSFLMYNEVFKIQFFNTYALQAFPDIIKEMPLFGVDIGGCLWLKKMK
jgi:predicted O-methyltransferase YrrM